MKFKLFVCKYFAWFFVQSHFSVKTPKDISPGRIILRHRTGKLVPGYRNSVYIAVSTVKPVLLEGKAHNFFYTLSLGDFDFSHYPVPDCKYTGDMGIEPYPNGVLHESHRSYVLPFSISPEHLAELVEMVKKTCANIIKYDSRFSTGDSPFV